jgi:3-oxoacyl-[acyl-carrier protein] reductase
MGELSGRIAVVTGVSHANGIGAAAYRKLAGEGATVFYTSFMADSNWESNFTAELKQLGAGSAGMELDLSDPSAPELLLNAVTETFGTPDILVNNAAHSTNDGYEKLDAETLDKHYAVNVRATCLLCVIFAR